MGALYCTADRVGAISGGGIVTRNEYTALSGIWLDTLLIDQERIGVSDNPFELDERARKIVPTSSFGSEPVYLAHFYAGCFTKTTQCLKERGIKISYTAAAHDRRESEKEWRMLVGDYPFPHLVDEKLWNDYVEGYRNANLVICPSSLSRTIMESYGCSRVTVIPHGIEIPRDVKPLPKRFVVGYLGQVGPDKGIIYLLQAWKKLGYSDACLILAGRGTESLIPAIRQYGGGNIQVMGFVKDISSFFNSCSVYVQPSVTEGFGIEVLEAMAYGRPVVVSNGAGASDLVDESVGYRVPPRNPDAIADCIDCLRKWSNLEAIGSAGRKKATNYAWDKIRLMYQETWRNL